MGKTLFRFKTGLIVAAVILFSGYAHATRIKDLAGIKGVRENQLVGYGLVVGLDGTGDGKNSKFTFQSLASMLERMGVTVNAKDIEKTKNVAAVMVTADLPPFARVGTKIDITVSSIGDAESLTSGTLLVTPLKGADGKVYAVAQGPISTDAFSVSGKAASVSKNFPTVARIVGGATIENEISYNFVNRGKFSLTLPSPNFTNATRMAETINLALNGNLARTLDAGTVEVEIPEEFSGRTAELVAMIEQLDITPDKSSKVVFNERTGTVVIGENVKIATVAISHGNLSIEIKETANTSQPMPFAPEGPIGGAAPVTSEDGSAIIAPGGATTVTYDTGIDVKEEKSRLFLVKSTVTIAEVVRALNALGVTPRDLMAIFQALKVAGALHATIEVM